MLKWLSLLILLSGCTGHVIMSPESSAGLSSGKDIEGVLVRRSIQVIEVDQYTQIATPAPKSSSADATSQSAPVMSGACQPVETRKLVTIPDPNHLWRLHYDPGILEAHTFGATMDISGVLLSINTQSTPDQGTTAANLAGAAVSAKSVVGVTLKGPVSPAAPLPPCTTSPSLIRFDSVQSLLQSTP
jgi:hypothetical protein